MNRKNVFYAVVLLLIALNSILFYVDSINVEDQTPDISLLIKDITDSISITDEFEKIDKELLKKNFEKKWIYSKKTDSLWTKNVKAPDSYSLSRYNYFLQKVFRENNIPVIKVTEHELSNKLIFNFRSGDSVDAVLELRVVKDLDVGNIKLGGNVALLVNCLGDEWGPEWITKLFRSEMPLSVGIVPGRWAVSQVVNEAGKYGKEVLISLPMEPDKGNIDKEKYKIIKGMNDFTISIVMDKIYDQIPDPVGVINYKGSKVIGDFNTMDFLIKNISKRGLYYIESNDHGTTYSALLSAQYGVPFTDQEVIYFSKGTDTSQIERVFRNVSDGQDVLIVIDADESSYNTVSEFMLKMPDINIITVSQFVSLNKL
ncbi:MAG: divergent polysaccharide deacetylase family protein [Candidatus Delongbacteria bacterium]|nr:divergent polysaccharide deacetylase family protein [Candidatus Delongbacteria bacterium]